MQRLSLSSRDVHTYSGLSQAFFGLATMPLAFERMCSQPITSPLVSAALSLLGCGFDQARKRVRWEERDEGARGEGWCISCQLTKMEPVHVHWR